MNPKTPVDPPRASLDSRDSEKVKKETPPNSEQSEAPKVGEGSSHDVTDLILLIHGIGQGVSTKCL